ncbi:MAG: glucokinase [Halioglobus sp.]
MNSHHKRLVADVGGTNTRIALYESGTGEFRATHTYTNRDFEKFEDVVESWLDNLDEEKPDNGCIAVAAPPSADTVVMSNMDWVFSSKSVSRRFGFKRFQWINDFVAVAYALPFLRDTDRHQLYSAATTSAGDTTCAKLAGLGPGTGLGGATIESVNQQLHPVACEPGQMSLAPKSELEFALFRHLAKTHETIFTELLVSGPGLLRIYQGLCEVKGEQPKPRSPQQISSIAQSHANTTDEQALAMFCGLLGSVAGDFVLANGSYGGLYLAGGIVPGFIDYLATSDFHARFCEKGTMKKHMESVPVYVITAPQPGLIGAAHAPFS